MPKRKISDENRQFVESWETEFFVIGCGEQPLCLLCKKKIGVMKRYNISRHYTAYHAETYDSYSAQCRRDTVNRLKLQHEDEEKIQTSNAPSTSQQQSLAASYSVAIQIARSKKCFSDAELIKKCAIEMAKAFGNESAVKSFQSVTLSRTTVSRRVSEINEDIENNLKCLLEKCRYFSLCLDESTDISDISQLSIFVRIIDDEFCIQEELLALVPMHGTTKGVDIFNAVRQEVQKYGGFAKCTAIVTDGAAAMVGHVNGFRGLLKKHGITCYTFHCIIHQEALCGKILMLSSTMKIVTKITNLIRGGNRALSHRKFKNFLEQMNASYGDLPLYSDVRWLSAGRTLQHFFNLRTVIPEFLKQEVKGDSENMGQKFKDVNFLSELAFLTDVTHHLNCLNINLQKQQQTVSDLVGYIKGFQNQLQLFISELRNNELCHFPSCKEIGDEYPDANFVKFVSPIVKIQKQFETRFKDFDALQKDLIIFNNARGCKIVEQENLYKLELCNVQADPLAICRNEYGLDFFKLLAAEKYPKLVDLGLKICSMFGSTYKCESSFSVMSNIKSKYRSSLTDDSLRSLLRIATTNISIDIPSLVDKMINPQCSH